MSIVRRITSCEYLLPLQVTQQRLHSPEISLVVTNKFETNYSNAYRKSAASTLHCEMEQVLCYVTEIVSFRLCIIAKSADLGKSIEKLLPMYHEIGMTEKLKQYEHKTW